MEQEPIDLGRTYFHIEGDGAEVLPVDAHFWPDVMAGKRRLDGWLVAFMQMDLSPGHAEMHPEGDEILVLLSGQLEVVFEDEARRPLRVVALEAGQACFVPRGQWHRQVVIAPGQLLALTCGRGTQHRPAEPGAVEPSAS